MQEAKGKKSAQRESTDEKKDVVEQITPITLEDIFSGIKDNERRLVLIEGAPGTGKSTLAHHMSKRWGSGELFQEYTAVVRVELRDPQVRDAKSLADILPCANEAMANRAEKAMTDALGKGVLMILDGWDELPSSLPADSIIKKLVKPTSHRGSPIPKASIILTSRPTSSAELHPLVSSRIEIQGFTVENIEEYFKECLNDTKAFESLMERIRENPVIEGSCSNPFTASMLAHIFISEGLELPRSNHEIFNSFVQLYLSRYMQDRLGICKEEATVTSLENLPKPVKNLFTQVCSLAYYGIRRNQTSLFKDDFKSARATLNVCDFGFLRKLSRRSGAAGMEEYYEFLHLSIQELLAAIHISHMPVRKQKSVFKKLLGNPRFTAVFQFYAGKTKLKLCRPIVRRLLYSLSYQEPSLRRLFSLDGAFSFGLIIAEEVARDQLSIGEPIKNHLSQFSYFLKERSRLSWEVFQSQLLPLLHCLYEAKNPSLAIMVAENSGRHGLSLHISLSPLDCLSVGYFLSVIASTNKWFSVDLSRCSIGDQGCKLLLRGFMESLTQPHPDTTGKIELDISNNRLCESSVQYVAELVHRLQVYRFEFCWNPIGDIGVKHLFEALCTNNTLEFLELEGCSLTLSDDTGSALSQYLSSNKLIKRLNLSQNPISNNGMKHLCEALCINSTLEDLNLEECSLTLSDDTGPALSQLLSNNKSIKTLDLSHNSCTDCGHLAAGLSNNKTLTRLMLTSCELTDDSVEQLCTGLGNHIESLHLDHNDSLTVRGFHHLAGHVSSLSALRWLVLPKHLKSFSEPGTEISQFLR